MASKMLPIFSVARRSQSTAFKTATRAEELSLPSAVGSWVADRARLTEPSEIHVCDGSEAEAHQLLALMEREGMARRLPKHRNCWLTRTDPADVARVESKTLISTPNRRDTVPTPRADVKGALGNWISEDDLQKAEALRWPGAMRGRRMYVVPFCMGPIGSPLAKIGIELTDSPYVAASMGVMTRMGAPVLEALGSSDDFTRALHSVGVPLPANKAPVHNWPCNPELTMIAHRPHLNSIASFGSGYGGNSLLGKKCLALRLGSYLAQKEGWLAEHMLILGVTPPSGPKRYIAAAFPSACGKTNLAMMLPTIPGYKIECVGDDIAWMKFDKEGRLRAINPEAGFFGVAPGTSQKTNPIAMDTIQSNTLFTNVAETRDGGFYWEGMEKELPEGMGVTDWQGQPWTPGCGRPAAHPNSRFCTPMGQLPSLDPRAEDPEGVPIDAILFGGRRPEGFPLVFESFDWEQGVFYGASMRSQTTAAAEHKGDSLMHDPFAMRPFFGYNFGRYVQHWLDMPRLHPGARLPKVFQVNWFRRGPQNEFLWPGFGENSRVLDWVIRRVAEGGDGAGATAVDSPIGRLPKREAFNLDGLKDPVDWDALFDVPKDFWLKEATAVERYFDEQAPEDIPKEMLAQVDALRKRLNQN